MKTLLVLCTLILLALCGPARAISFYTPITPGNKEACGLGFEITGREAGDDVSFRIVVNEKQSKFRPGATALLCTIRITGISQSAMPIRQLEADKQNGSMVYVFSVRKAELSNPDLSFLFQNPYEGMPNVDLVYARLYEFFSPRPATQPNPSSPR